jgi:hypothetical protein
LAADSGIGALIVLSIAIFLYVTVERPCMELRSQPWVKNLGAPQEKTALQPVH